MKDQSQVVMRIHPFDCRVLDRGDSKGEDGSFIVGGKTSKPWKNP
jgi:hypothetical protein